ERRHHHGGQVRRHLQGRAGPRAPPARRRRRQRAGLHPQRPRSHARPPVRLLRRQVRLLLLRERDRQEGRRRPGVRLMKVSVILNSYNQAQYLEQAIESVLGQTYRDFEVLLTDNGSTDDSQRIAQKYAKHDQVRLILHPENRSISTRFNAAMKLATGDAISFVYSDVYYLPHKLERQVPALAALPEDYDAVYGPTLELNVLTCETWQQTVVSSAV